jgi:folate-binding protein YgfZ
MCNNLYSTAHQAVVLWRPEEFGYLRVAGADHVDLLHRMTTNSVQDLASGAGQVNIFATEMGRIVARVILMRSASSVALLTEKTSAQRLAGWIDKYSFIEDVLVEDLSGRYACVALFGPQAVSLIRRVFDIDTAALTAWQHLEWTWNNREVAVVRTAELSLAGYLLLGDKELCDELAEQIRQHTVQEIDAQTYQVLRIESGWPLARVDYDDSNNPHEAGLLPYLDFNKGCYIGQEVIARLDSYDKVKKRLTSLVLDTDTVALQGSKITILGEETGFITSCAFSPALEKTIALGYIRSKHCKDGSTVTIATDSDVITGVLTAPPLLTPDMIDTDRQRKKA